jgi:hypothetical protein
MKSSSIVGAQAVGLFMLVCTLPAGAAAEDTQHARSSRAYQRPAGMAQSKPRPPRAAALPTGADASANATASSQGGVGVGSQGQSLTIDNHARSAPSPAIAPALTGSNDTCMGSTSVGAAGMAFGLSLGTTYTDDNCTMLKNARELWNMGFRGAAVARMCMDERNRAALETSGVPCPTPPAARDAERVREREREEDRRDNGFRDAVSQRAQAVR